MNFICEQQSLVKAINTVMKAVPTRTTLPVLKGILIQATQDNRLILIASDLKISIKREIDAKVEESGSTVVIARLFGDIIRKLPGEQISIHSEDERSVTIRTNNSEFKVLCLPLEEYPSVWEKDKKVKQMKFNSHLFKEMVRKTAFAASVDESKGALTGILTEIEENAIKMISLDGFRLALVQEKIHSSEPEQFIIDARSMNEVNKIISDNEEENSIVISLGDKNAVFSVGKTQIIVRLLEGEFVRYKTIIPNESLTTVRINKEMLLESIERASLLAKEGKNNLIKMTIENDLITITSRSEEGKVREEIIVEKTGNNLEIGFNSKFMIDVLKVIEDEQITLNFQTGINPCVLKPIEGDRYRFLVLPVRIPRM